MDTNSCATTIIMLVKEPSAAFQTAHLKLIMIVVDAWKRIDRTFPFDAPENVYEFVGNVAQPPMDKQSRKLYSHDKIKSVQLIEND